MVGLLSGLPDKTLSLHTRWSLKHRQQGILCKGLFAELPRYKFQASKPTHLKRLPTQVLVFSNVFLNYCECIGWIIKIRFTFKIT